MIKEVNTNIKAFLRRAAELRPSPVLRKNKTRKCLVCSMYIHKDMESCQPCQGAKPTYSMLHKFEPIRKHCQICGKPYNGRGFNCTPCNEGIKKRDQERADNYDGSENYCGGY